VSRNLDSCVFPNRTCRRIKVRFRFRLMFKTKERSFCPVHTFDKQNDYRTYTHTREKYTIYTYYIRRRNSYYTFLILPVMYITYTYKTFCIYIICIKHFFQKSLCLYCTCVWGSLPRRVTNSSVFIFILLFFTYSFQVVFGPPNKHYSK